MSAMPSAHGLMWQLLRSLPFSTISLTLLSCITSTAALGTASDYYVRSLPGAPPGPLLRMHAGHVEVSEEHHGSLFFWHFQNRHIQGSQRTVIWLNGGPGCSSMDGSLMEIGPYRVREGGNLEYNEGSWDEYANLLFVDNPVGTGFSYVDSDAYVQELPEMANQFMTFLENWFRVFPEYENDDLYIAGESYAGQHIPYIARAILDRNRNIDFPQVKWNLQGLLIGNGWVSNKYQSTANLDFALSHSLLMPDSEQAHRVQEQVARCRETLEEEEGGIPHVDTAMCEGVLQAILRETRDAGAPEDQQCVNMYDIKLRDSYPSCGMNWPPDLETITPYLRDPDVINALHIDPSKKAQGWVECNGQVGQAFTARNSVPSYNLLPGLLEQIPIVLFSGADDMICNHLGTERLIEALDWNGGIGFPQDAPTREWTFDDQLAGTYRQARNLTYLLFYDSSHMVPFDHPRRTRDMLDRFTGLDTKFRFEGSFVQGEDPVPNLSDLPDRPDQPTQPDRPVEPVEPEPVDDTHPPSDEPDTSDSPQPFEGSIPAPDTTAESEEEAEALRLQQARWDAYYRSGEVALVFVILGAGLWGWYVLRDRRRRAGYRNVPGGSARHPVNNANGTDVRLEAFRSKTADLEDGRIGEAYADNESKGVSEEQARRYSLGSAGSESEDDGEIVNRRS